MPAPLATCLEESPESNREADDGWTEAGDSRKGMCSCVPSGEAEKVREAGTYGKRMEADADPMARFRSTLEQLQAQEVAHIDGYVLFGSHVDALALFQACKELGYSARISPTPRDARSSCGVALLIPSGNAESTYRLALERGIPVESMVALPRQIDAHRDRYC